MGKRPSSPLSLHLGPGSKWLDLARHDRPAMADCFVTVERPVVSLAPSADALDSKKGDRLKISDAVIREPMSAGGQETSVEVAVATPLQRHPPTEVRRQMSGHASEIPRHTTLIRAGTRKIVKLIRVPETRPTTVEGWTLRDVTNGTATLEGPNCTWRVVRGDTVPGLGKVDSIFQWGNRLMVSTSKGLVSTP